MLGVLHKQGGVEGGYVTWQEVAEMPGCTLTRRLHCAFLVFVYVFCAFFH